jgi:hypothetical protein
MYMMFVDESGDPGYPADGKWTHFGGSKIYTKVGVILHGWKWKAWNMRLLQFKKDNGLVWNDEIKASFIRRGKGCFIGWDLARRMRFLNDLASLIGQHVDITLIGIVIDKRKVDISQSDRMVKPDIRSMEFLLERYNSFLDSQKDKAGIVVVDPTHENSDDEIRYFQSYLQTHSEHLKPLHIVESTFFAKSHTSNMIQVADVCTNIFYHEMVYRRNEELYKAIYGRFHRIKGKVKGVGIKIWPS